MILIFGYSLVYLTGIIAGILFLLSFLGCCCHQDSRLNKFKLIREIRKNHKTLIYFALFSSIIHIIIALLSRAGFII